MQTKKVSKMGACFLLVITMIVACDNNRRTLKAHSNEGGAPGNNKPGGPNSQSGQADPSGSQATPAKLNCQGQGKIEGRGFFFKKSLDFSQSTAKKVELLTPDQNPSGIFSVSIQDIGGAANTQTPEIKQNISGGKMDIIISNKKTKSTFTASMLNQSPYMSLAYKAGGNSEIKISCQNVNALPPSSSQNSQANTSTQEVLCTGSKTLAGQNAGVLSGRLASWNMTDTNVPIPIKLNGKEVTDILAKTNVDTSGPGLYMMIKTPGESIVMVGSLKAKNQIQQSQVNGQQATLTCDLQEQMNQAAEAQAEAQAETPPTETPPTEKQNLPAGSNNGDETPEVTQETPAEE